MKTITTNNRTLLFVEVPSPSDGGGFRIESNTFRYEQYGWKGWSTKSVELPSGNYRFISTTDNAPADLGITDTLLSEHSITGRHAIIEVL